MLQPELKLRRDKIRALMVQQDIDAVLQKSPESFDALLHELQALGYEIKYGKHISVKDKNQSHFIRLSSLENGYTEIDLRAYFFHSKHLKPKGNTSSLLKTVRLIFSLIFRASCNPKDPGTVAGPRFTTLNRCLKRCCFYGIIRLKAWSS